MARALAEVKSRTIKHLARSKWQSSGLSDQYARRLGLCGMSAREVQTLNPRFHEAGALHIPYHDLDGKRTKFYRIRYLETLPGAAGLIENPQRYDQLPVLQEVYYPPLHKQTWREVAKNPKISVSITEGELKSACACANNIPMMALGGVYSFMSGKRGIDLLPSMKEFDWADRQVYVVYDNDLMNNQNVLRAQHVLSQRLLAEGAKISYIAIPPGTEKGVDDFIVKHGVKAFVELIDKAEPFPEADALWKLNSEVVLIKNDGVPIVVERDTSVAMAPDVFARVLFANRHYMKQVEKGSGKNKHITLEKDKLAPRWLEWEMRSELSRLTYEPGQPRIVGNSWNTWNGWGTIPRKGSIEPWVWLLDFLFSNDKKARKYFEQWCAYPIQNPGAKMFTAVVLWSRVKRLGKSLVGNALRGIYGDNAVLINPRQLKSQFNHWAKDRQLVIGEEITAGEARIDADYLKDLITSPIFTINSKFKAEYTIPNHTNFLFLSNHPDAMFLEDGDKRYLIHGINHYAPAEKPKYRKYVEWLEAGGAAHLMDYFLRLDMRGFSPSDHAPETTSKYEMIIAGKTDVSLWVQKLLEDPVNALKRMGEKAATGCDLFTAEQLYRAYDPEGRAKGRASESSLGRALQTAGMRPVNGCIPLMTDTGLHRLRAVRNSMKWEQATRREIREHYNSFFGPHAAGEVK